MNRHAGSEPWSSVNAAKRDVERAERMLSHRLEEAGIAGHATVERALSLVRPVVFGAIAAAGLVWLVSSLRRTRRRGFVLPEASRPSVMHEAVRAATLSLASMAARRIGERWFARGHALRGSDVTEPTLAGHPVPPRD